MKHGHYFVLDSRWMKKMPLSNERWKTVHPPFLPIYEVSNKGRVRTLDEKGNVKRINKQSPDTKGYLRVNLLTESGERKCVKVHRLVAMAFVPNPEGKPTIDHINGDIANNADSNLRWATVKENNNNPITWERFLEARRNRERAYTLEVGRIGQKVPYYCPNLQEASLFLKAGEDEIHHAIKRYGVYYTKRNGVDYYAKMEGTDKMPEETLF